MATSEVSHNQLMLALVRGWARRHQAGPADCAAALGAVNDLAADRHVYPGARSLAWWLLVDTHAARGRPLPDVPGIAACRSAAASASHSANILSETIGESLAGHDASRQVLLLGDLASGWSLLGRWDLLPARGALLVDLDQPADTAPTSTLRAEDGVRWAAAGGLRELLADRAPRVDLHGRSVQLPPPELILARAAPGASNGEAAAAFLFTAAADACLSRSSWPTVQELASRLGVRAQLREAVLRCGLDHVLDLKLSAIARARAWFRTMHRRAALS